MYGLGPSSNVSAMHLTCRAVDVVGLATRTWPVRPPTITIRTAAKTPVTIRQYVEGEVSGRLRTRGSLPASLMSATARRAR